MTHRCIRPSPGIVGFVVGDRYSLSAITQGFADLVGVLVRMLADPGAALAIWLVRHHVPLLILP
jgi:hypothetical protein